MNKKIKEKRFLSPLRYPGGKSKQSKLISNYFPNEMEKFIEPFIGGGSVSLEISNSKNVKEHIINDFDIRLYNFWKGAKYYNKEVLEILEHTLKLKEFGPESFKEKYWENIKRNIDIGDEVNKCASYLIVNKMGFNGLTGGFSKGAFKSNYTISTIERFKDLDILLKDINIFGVDYKEILENNNDESTYVYLDPPYSKNGANQKLYKDHENFNHEELSNILKEYKGKWVLSYEDSDYIRKLYKDFIIDTKEWNYSMTNNKKSGKTTKGKELFIRNFHII